MNASGNVISLQNVTKLYRTVAAVKDLNLDVKPGEIVGIIGHNGAGKSTTLKMILGLIRPSRGTVNVLNRDMAQEPTDVKQRIGYLPEESSLYDNMSVVDYLTFFSRLYNLPPRRAVARIDTLLESLQLEARDKLTIELSKGMRRKVAIARALLHDPELLILDEPNSGLDPLTSFFVINYLQELRRQGKTILVSAHNLFHIELICDRVVILKEGELVVCDRMDAIRDRLGNRGYEVHFRTAEPLTYPQEQGNYVFRSSSIGEIAGILETISRRQWNLVNLAVRESALEDIYVRLMTGQPVEAGNGRG
jgi:ABC-2 type transport system ATP-binding protein